MDEKFMYIPNDDKQNYSFCRLQLLIETFGHSIKIQCKSLKLLSQKINKLYYKNLGTSVMKSPLSPPSLPLHIVIHSEYIIITNHQIFRCWRGGRGQWAVYYTSPQSLMLAISYSSA